MTRPASLLTPPVIEPVTLEEAKLHLRVDSGADDKRIGELISAAREDIEASIGRALIDQEWELKLDAFPCGDRIEFDHPPLLSVTSVVYVDTTGVSQTWAASNYVVTTPAGPRPRAGSLHLAHEISWPAVRAQRDAVTITYRAGYGTTAAAVPSAIRTAVLLQVELLYDRDRAAASTLESAKSSLLAKFGTGGL